jgi:Tfp pilus assembly protein PilO
MEIKKLTTVNTKKKIIIGSIAFPLIIGSIIYFIVLPTIKDIEKMRNEIEMQRVDLEMKYIKGQSLKKLSENLKTIEPQLAKLDKIFIDQDQVLEFVTTLEEIANINGIDQKINLMPEKSVKKNRYKKIPLQIFASGNFFKQLNYLMDLETLNYYININSIELTAGAVRSAAKEEQDMERDVNMLIFADTYWR